MASAAAAAPARLAALKAQLAKLRYDQPLGLESAPLVERLVADLAASHARQAELQALCDKRADELAVAEQHLLPVRKENSRLVRENNELHMRACHSTAALPALARRPPARSRPPFRRTRGRLSVCLSLSLADPRRSPHSSRALAPPTHGARSNTNNTHTHSSMCRAPQS